MEKISQIIPGNYRTTPEISSDEMSLRAGTPNFVSKSQGETSRLSVADPLDPLDKTSFFKRVQTDKERVESQISAIDRIQRQFFSPQSLVVSRGEELVSQEPARTDEISPRSVSIYA